METNYDLDKLKALVHSHNPADAELALAVGESLGLPIRDYYNEWMTVYRFWTSTSNWTSHKNTSLGAFIAALKEEKGIYLRRLEIKKICPESRLLADWVEFFDIDYASTSRFPEGLGAFINIKKINVASGDLKEANDEIWQLPKLEKINWCIRKNFAWEPNILYAQQLKQVSLQALTTPDVPIQLAQLPKLSEISLYGMGSSGKDACSIPAVVWDCVGLKHLRIAGKPYLPFDNELQKMQELETISLYYTHWKELPKSLCLLPKLRKLEISASPLKRLPDWLPQLGALESLSLRNLKQIKDFYPIIKQTPQLKELLLDKILIDATPREQWLELFPNIVAAPMAKWEKEPSYYVLQRP